MTAWFLTRWKACALGYARHPELMTPFLLQGALGYGFAWLLIRRLASGAPDADLLGGAFVLLVSLISLLFQGWTLRWGHDLFEGAPRPLEALQAALRKGVSLLGVSLWVSLPGAILVMLLLAATSGWVAAVGMALTAALVNWVVLFALLGVLVGGLRAWNAIREGFLLLGERPGAVLPTFGLLLLYGLLNASYTGGNTLVALLSGDPSALDPLWTALTTVLGAALSPPIYLMCVAFYRGHAHNEPQEADL